MLVPLLGLELNVIPISATSPIPETEEGPKVSSVMRVVKVMAIPAAKKHQAAASVAFMYSTHMKHTHTLLTHGLPRRNGLNGKLYLLARAERKEGSETTNIHSTSITKILKKTSLPAVCISRFTNSKRNPDKNDSDM